MIDLEQANRRVLQGKLKGLPKKPLATTRGEEEDGYVGSVSDIADPKTACASLLSRLRNAAAVRQARDDEWEFALRAWHQRPTAAREDSWESDRYLPVVLKHVETALPAIVAATLDPKGLFRLHGMTRQGKEAARAHERLVNYQVGAFQIEEAYEDMFWWATLLGTGYLDHSWDLQEEEREVPVVTQDPQAPGGKRKTFARQKIKVADNPAVEALNPFDVWPAPSARMGADADYFFIRVETTVGELRDAAGKGHIDGPALEAWLASEPDADSDRDWLTEYTQTRYRDILIDVDHEADRNEDGEDRLAKERVVTVLKYVSKVETVTLGGPDNIIGYSRNPYLHGKTGIVIHHFFKVPNSPFGRGLGGVLRGHQELANENVNAWMDTANLERMAPILVDRARANLLDDELVMQPNAVLRVRGTDAVKRMEMPAPTNLAMQVDSHLMRDADDLTGFTEQSRGLSPQANQTATAFQGLQSNLRTRLITHVRRSGRTIQRSGELLVAMNQQLYTDTQMVEFVGEDGLEYAEITPTEIVGKMVVGVSVSTSRASPDVRAQRLQALLQILIPLVQTGMLQQPQVRRLVRMVMDANEIEDADLLLPRGDDRKKDPRVENALLAKQIAVPVNAQEEHSMHLEVHNALLQELLDNEAPDAILAVVKDHIEAHFDALAQAQQQAMAQAQAAEGGTPEQQAQGASGAGINPGAGGANQEAALAGAGTGGQGTPGVSAPGPAGPGQQR